MNSFSGDSSLLRIHHRDSPKYPNGFVLPATNSIGNSSSLAPTSPLRHISNSNLRHSPRASPRQVKLQRVEPFASKFTLQSEVAANFRHELFQFHQLLRDVIENCRNVKDDSEMTTKASLGSLTSLFQQDRSVLDLLTSDRGDAVLREFFRKWRHDNSKASRANVPEEDADVLNQVLETLFNNLPLVVSEGDAKNAKSFFRYVDALKSLRAVLIFLLYKRHPENEEDNDDSDEDEMTTPGFSLFRIHQQARTNASKPANTRPKLLPYYQYCQQLEQEIQTLNRRLSVADRSPSSTAVALLKKNEELGVLHDHTLTLLLDFWDLPKVEKLGFFCQIASHTKEEDAAMIFRVFLENCTTQNLLHVWEVLQVLPHFQAVLSTAMKKELQQTVNATATEEQTGTVTKSVRQHAGEEEDPEEERREDQRRASVKMRHMNTQQQQRINRFVNSLTQGFEEEDEQLDDSDDGDDNGDDNDNGKRRLHRKLVIRERGRTPPDQRKLRNQHENRYHRREHQRYKDEPETENIAASNSKEQPHHVSPKDQEHNFQSQNCSGSVLERLHSDLTELIKEEFHRPSSSNGSNSQLPPPSVVMDAAWKLLELLDSWNAKDSKSGLFKPQPRPVRHALTDAHLQPQRSQKQQLQQKQHEYEQSPAIPVDREVCTEVTGQNLTPEQQFLIKLDQLQALLTSLGKFSLLEMSTDVITSVYRRMPALSKLFQGLSEGSQLAADVGGRSSPLSLETSAPASGSSVRASISSLNPANAEDQMMNAMQDVLTKISRMLRNLEPLVAINGDDGSSSGTTAAKLDSLAIMKLADDFEGEGNAIKLNSGKSPDTVSYLQTPPMQNAQRRATIIQRLRALGANPQLDQVTEMLAATAKDIQHQQQEQVSLKADRQRAKRVSIVDDGESMGDDDTDDDYDDEVDEVMKLVKQAKRVRRTSRAQMVQDLNDDTDTTATTGIRFRDIPTSIKQAAPQRGMKLFNTGILLRVIDQSIVLTPRDVPSFRCTATITKELSRRFSMEADEWSSIWLENAGAAASTEVHPVAPHTRKKSLPVPISLLDRWSVGTFSGSSKHRIEHTPRQFKVRISFAITTIQEALSERFGVYFRTMDALAARIRAQALKQDEEFIKENDLLGIVVEEWVVQRQRIEQVLEAVYVAGDSNGDGNLEYDEFAAVVFHLSPNMDDKFLQKVFTAAHDHVKPRRISFERFIDVILLERILNTNPVTKTTGFSSGSSSVSSSTNNGGKNEKMASNSILGDDRSTSKGQNTHSSNLLYSRASQEEEEKYQFTLLQDTWEHDREIVMNVLRGIMHQQTAASLTFRVSFLDQILSKRVDSKTAWMCHRQIMREISRYQNLNEEQIVVLKKKEETFKKAVMAIRNLQRMGVLATSMPKQMINISHLSSIGEIGAYDITVDNTSEEDHSYTTAVEQTLALQKTHLADDESPVYSQDSNATLDEIMALEDQLREKFLEQADENAIEDYKTALQQIRRLSLQNFAMHLTPDQLQTLSAMQTAESIAESDEDDSDDDDDDTDDISDREHDEADGEIEK